MKFLLSLVATVLLILLLDKSWVVGTNRIPPPGKFLDPFHGFWQNAEPKGFIRPDELNLPGLNDKVIVSYDSLLIPHIFAGNDEDLYMAQGCITAVYRLWQMEFQVHAAAGRISSILGVGEDSVFLNYDRRQRRLGLAYAAEKATREMLNDPVSRAMVEAYTHGINQHIKSLTYKNLPLEYKLMDYWPESWSPLKCGLLLKNMAQTLNMGDKDIEMTNALTLFGKEMVDLLYPDREPDAAPIVDNPGGWNFTKVDIDSVPPALPQELIGITAHGKIDPTVGSNNWAVGGSKTASGSPILCNDPHLNTTLPSIWFAVQLNAPGINTMGVSLPGAPGVIIGFTDSIAWGITNAQRDLVDWYRITYKDSKRENYLIDGQWKQTSKVIEEIDVRGQASFYDTIVFTQWGPIPYDANFRPRDGLRDYAFRWTSHDPSLEVLTFYKLNRAKNFNDYMAALDYFSAPPQNFVFASVSGDIAIRVQGKFPVRRKDEGKFLLDGSKSSNGWQAFIPVDQNVMIKNPSRGFVSSANQYPADKTYPYFITATSYEAYRNRRINDILDKLSNVTVRDMMSLQNDNFNLKASESLPFFLNAVDSSGILQDPPDSIENAEALRDAYDILKSWDYVNNKDSEGASYYEAWWDHLMPTLWDEMSNREYALSRPTTYNTIKLMKEEPSLDFFSRNRDNIHGGNLNNALVSSFIAGVFSIEEWEKKNAGSKVRWADYKDTYVQHLARIPALSYHVEHGGNHDIVNASARTHGPSWRMVVSLEKSGVKAFAVYPGGQSGNPGSLYYNNMLDHWSNGKYYQLTFPQRAEDLKDNLFFSTQLTPKSK
jgi:penicillin amidase